MATLPEPLLQTLLRKDQEYRWGQGPCFIQVAPVQGEVTCVELAIWVSVGQLTMKTSSTPRTTHLLFFTMRTPVKSYLRPASTHGSNNSVLLGIKIHIHIGVWKGALTLEGSRKDSKIQSTHYPIIVKVTITRVSIAIPIGIDLITQTIFAQLGIYTGTIEGIQSTVTSLLVRSIGDLGTVVPIVGNPIAIKVTKGIGCSKCRLRKENNRKEQID